MMTLENFGLALKKDKEGFFICDDLSGKVYSKKFVTKNEALKWAKRFANNPGPWPKSYWDYWTGRQEKSP